LRPIGILNKFRKLRRSKVKDKIIFLLAAFSAPHKYSLLAVVFGLRFDWIRNIGDIRVFFVLVRFAAMILDIHVFVYDRRRRWRDRSAESKGS